MKKYLVTLNVLWSTHEYEIEAEDVVTAEDWAIDKLYDYDVFEVEVESVDEVFE